MHHHCRSSPCRTRPRHRANPGVGHVVLLSGGLCDRDCCRDRLVAWDRGQRHLDRAFGGRTDLAASRPHHRPSRRPPGPAREFAVFCRGPDRRRAGAEPAGVTWRRGWSSASAWAPELYDAVFATLGRLYGNEARGPITNLTLFGGFASTVCWPLSAFMIDHTGWRTACLIYAGLHLVVSLPLQMAVVRRAPARSRDGQHRGGRCRGGRGRSPSPMKA